MELVIYQEAKNNLSEIAFLKDLSTQKKIRDIDSYEFTKQLSLLFSKINIQLGIKNPISEIHKADIKELILMRFKSLSLNEIEYGFKLERYGVLEPKTEHFHDFNAVYISEVLNKYLNWKRKTKSEHNIVAKLPKERTTEKEKQYWINKGVSECVEHYEKTFTIMDGKLYVYEILYDLGMLPNDNEYKKKKYNEAKEVIEFEISSTKNKSLSHKKEMDEILKEIQLPKSGKLINKAKELILLEFFRVLTKDEVKLEEFKQRFKN